jgi:hypothetical protein
VIRVACPRLDRVVHLFETGRVGEPVLGRDGRLARIAYLGALLRLERAILAWQRGGPVLDPHSRRALADWTPAQSATMVELGRAWQHMLDKRREYDAVRRARPTA